MMRVALRPTRVFLTCFLLLSDGSACRWGAPTTAALLIILPLTALLASLLFGAACASLTRQPRRSENPQGGDKSEWTEVATPSLSVRAASRAVRS